MCRPIASTVKGGSQDLELVLGPLLFFGEARGTAGRCGADEAAVGASALGETGTVAAESAALADGGGATAAATDATDAEGGLGGAARVASREGDAARITSHPPPASAAAPTEIARPSRLQRERRGGSLDQWATIESWD